MAKLASNLTYLELDPANFSAKQKKAAAAIVQLQAQLKAANEAFITASQDRVQGYYDHIVSNGGNVGGTVAQLSTRFGKFSIFFTAAKGTENKRSMKV